MRMSVKNTLAIDLSTSFSTATKNSSIGILEISKGQCPNLNSILFWNDENRQTVYAYGGWFSSFNNDAFDASALPSETLWAFVANNSYGTWQDFNQSSNPVFNSLTRPTFGSATSGAIGGFGLGGYEFSQSSLKTQNLTSLVPSPGLQFYNSTAQSWYNNSGEGYTPEGTSVYAGAIYLPTWGTAGLVAIFGGQTTSNRTNFIDGDNYLSMSNISLFDPSSQSWYFQESTGDVPSQRDRFCVVGASGGDKTTFGKPSRTATLNTITVETDTLFQKYSYTLGRLGLVFTTGVRHQWLTILSAMRCMFYHCQRSFGSKQTTPL